MTTAFRVPAGYAPRARIVPPEPDKGRRKVSDAQFLKGVEQRQGENRRGPRSRQYLSGYLRSLRLIDLMIISGAIALAQALRFGLSDTGLINRTGLPVGYTVVSIGLVLGWMFFLHVQKAYDARVAGQGVQEYRQVFHASLWLFAALAIASFAFKLDFARGYVLIAFPVGTLALLAGRWLARQWLVRQRRELRYCDRVLLVGDYNHVDALVAALDRSREAGYNVIGACVDGDRTHVRGVPIIGPEADVLVKAMDLDVDVVAVSSSSGLGPTGMRQLGWALETTDINLVVAPGIMDVAGPRVLTRPVQGLPLLHVEAPAFAGPQLMLKTFLDRMGALILVLLLSPVFLVVGLLVWLEDRGPIFFRQERVGLGGEMFKMIKFRSMVRNAEELRTELMVSNEAAGPLFKMDNDPRITKIGRVIRRYSLDELPQLFNVLRGDMSLVGPRPSLPSEVEEYEPDAYRRMLVKPGMTGLWQINGRSRLPWEEAVRLDLYYVENWTPVLDLIILFRTAMVVLRPDSNGAA